jgi:hypothetical protein
MRTFISLKEKYNDIMQHVIAEKRNYVHEKLINLFETMIQQQVDEFKIQLENDDDGNKRAFEDPLLAVREIICKYYNIPVSGVLARNRVAEINNVRQLCMWSSKYLTEYFSLNHIGSYYNRDHATVLNAIRKLENLYAVDVAFRTELERLLLHLQNEGIDVKEHFKMLSKIKVLK